MEHPRFPVYVMDLPYPEMGLSAQTGTGGSTTIIFRSMGIAVLSCDAFAE